MGSPPRPSSPPRPGTKGRRGDAGYDAVLSPLSRSLWDSPPGHGGINKSTPPSSQRKLHFGFEPENVENDKHLSRNKCKKGLSKTTTVAFSDQFPESPNKAGSSLLLGPRLSRRKNPPPIDGALPMEGNSESQHRHSSSSTCYGVPMPKLAPKSPSIKKKPTRPKLSPRKDPMSPLHPPSIRANSDMKYFENFTLTPTVLYNGRGGHYNHSRPHMAPTSASSSQHYHQSPHWSGQVRVNPFSPVPEQYLRPPPSSTKSATRGNTCRSRSQHSEFYNLNFINLDPPSLPANPPPQRSLAPRKDKSRFNPPRLPRAASRAAPQLDDDQDFFDGISPTEVTQANSDSLFNTNVVSGSKRKAPPQSMDTEGWLCNKRIKRGRYLEDFQEVQFLGAGSFGSVNACLSRLDGCMYAVKSISPTGQIKKGNDQISQTTELEGTGYLYGGRRMMSNQCAIPPTPRPDPAHSPLRRKRPISRFGVANDDLEMMHDSYNLGDLEGSSHWNDSALRRVLREVFALAALCQQDDVRTFHIVRYQQAWLEDDGTLYIQTELCSATLRDEMQGKVINGKGLNSSVTSGQTIDVFRQLKILREVLLALELVHEQGMVHLDIKPENIFVKNNFDSKVPQKQKQIYKLGDFGLANVFSKSGGRAAAAPDIDEGDSRYMSKDLLDFNPKDLTKCDIFSLGATMYEVISRRPLPSCGQEWQNLRNGKFPPLPKGTMPCINTIIREMMHPNPEKRPSASDLLSREALSGQASIPLVGTSRSGPSFKVCSSKVTSAGMLKRSMSWSL